MRDIRNASHQKQNRTQIQKGIPSISDLSEGVPVLRSVDSLGIVEYIRYNGQLYSSAYTVSEPMISRNDIGISYLNDGTTGDTSWNGTASNTIDDNSSSIKDDLASLASKVNEIIKALRASNIISHDPLFHDTKGA